MNRTRAFVLAIAVVAAAVLAMLQLRHRERLESAETSRVPATTDAAEVTLASPSTAGDAPRTPLPAHEDSIPPAVVPKPAGLRVRSAEGLALAFVEVEDEPGRWRDVALVDGVCDPATLELPCDIRAPGHVTATAVRLEDEVVLPADALLVLEGDELRDCLLSIQLFAQYGPTILGGFDRVATFGYTSSDAWAIAVSGAGTIESLGYRQQIDVALTDRTHRLIQVEFRATPGARGRWTVPCDARLPVAPLDLAIVRPADLARGELVCNLIIDAERDVLRELPQSWGRVVLQPGLRFTREGRVPAHEDRWTVADVPLGENVVLTVMDQESRAYGRLFFVHDGTPQRIQLHAGFVLSGRIAIPAGTALPTRMNLCFGRPKDPPDGSVRIEPFSSDMRDVALGPDGSFEVRGPQLVPLWRELSADPPPELALEIGARGFEIHSSRWPLGAATRVDCGILALVPSRAPIVLARGSGFGDADLDWKALRIGASESDAWTVGCGRAELDGSVALVFDRDWLVRNEPGASRAWVMLPELMPHGIAPDAASTAAFVLDIDSAWGRAFVRGADRRYERVEEREYSIEAVTSTSVEPDSKLTLGWQWRGIPQRLVTLGPDRAGQRRSLRFTAPRDGARLWWSRTGRFDADTQSVELTSASASIEIP